MLQVPVGLGANRTLTGRLVVLLNLRGSQMRVTGRGIHLPNIVAV